MNVNKICKIVKTYLESQQNTHRTLECAVEVFAYLNKMVYDELETRPKVCLVRCWARRHLAAQSGNKPHAKYHRTRNLYAILRSFSSKRRESTRTTRVQCCSFKMMNQLKYDFTTLDMNIMALQVAPTSYLLISFKPVKNFEEGETTKQLNTGSWNLVGDKHWER